LTKRVKPRDVILPPTLSPRGLRRVEAAAYVGVSPSLFDEMVRSRVMPKPLRFGGRVIWDRKAIDQAFGNLANEDETEPDDDWSSIT
jgi:predicted DNA-binding transcriptional regulator AlpA